MTPEKQDSTHGEEATDANGEANEEAAPALNRAERRAQAKGKKSPAGGNNPSGLQNRAGGFTARTSFGVNKTRFPRTGHK